jgi:glutathione S-transferase
MLPILYSFRRCPFAIRARITLSYSAIMVEHREVHLRNKPQAMLDISAKGTVPVLLLPDGRVLDESRDIMRWALNESDPQIWWNDQLAEFVDRLIDENDDLFKVHLDQYKYWERFPQHSQSFYRSQCEVFLLQLEQQLANQSHLLADRITMADIAVFPFIRQFAAVDRPWFDQSPYPKLRSWLETLLVSSLFLGVMEKSPPWEP